MQPVLDGVAPVVGNVSGCGGAKLLVMEFALVYGAIRLATVPDDGPTGQLFDDNGIVPW